MLEKLSHNINIVGDWVINAIGKTFAFILTTILFIFVFYGIWLLAELIVDGILWVIGIK
jgi:hypothetical protein